MTTITKTRSRRSTTKRAGGSRPDVYQLVTDKIITALENGTVPWHRPWTTVGGARNLNSGRPYRGINAFLLALSEHSSPYWMTYEGAKRAGGNVRKGEKGTLVVLWRQITVKDGNELDDSGKPKSKRIPLLRYYTVFNLEQCDGIEAPETPADEFDPDAEAERVMDEMPVRPSIGYGGDSAHYRPATDHVQLPARAQFSDADGFYGTAFHELVHATGHQSRLGRNGDWTAQRFGSESYSQEELVAEMGAAMLAGQVGMEVRTEQSAAYIASWLRALRDDKKLVVVAAGQAQRAADFILGVQHDAQDAEADR